MQHVDVLKLDVQGSELQVLKGASGMLAAGGISLIYAEVHLVEVYEGQPLLHDVTRVSRSLRLPPG